MREIEKKHDIHEKSLSFYFNQEDKLFTFFKHKAIELLSHIEYGEYMGS